MRAYGPRASSPGALPAAALNAIPPTAHAEALAAMSAVGHLSYAPFPGAISARGARAVSLLLTMPGAPLPLALASVAGGAHEAAAADALAGLAALLDTHLPLATLDALAGGDAVLLGRVLGVRGAEAIMARGPHSLAPDAASLPVVLALDGPGGVELVPLFALALLTAGGGGDSSSVAGPAFRSLFAAVLHATVSAGDVARAAGRRALAAVRRAYPVTTLLTVALNALGSESLPRRQTVGLHLIRDMMGDDGGADFFASSEARTARLLTRAAAMLAAARAASFSSGGGGGGGNRKAQTRRIQRSKK